MIKYNAIILAGGKSSRMGMEKSLIEIEGRSMIEYSIQNASNAEEVLISSSHDVHAGLGLKIVEDQYKDIGPLGGLLSSLKTSSVQWNLVLATDVPYVTNELIELLKPRTNSEEVIIPSCNGKLHPLIGFYSKNIESRLVQYIEYGNRSVKGFLDEVVVREVVLNESFEMQLKNMNSPKDLNTNN